MPGFPSRRRLTLGVSSTSAAASPRQRSGGAEETGSLDVRRELSGREVEVVRLPAEGLGHRTTAEALFLSEATVRTHLVRIHRKLGADDCAAAVSEAVRRGLPDLA
ncbi:response regulator transcription factor [Streptomyces sp. NPDC058335]|uniref:response regulator transcription factor n=1 Tax=Streptomyces sp. NPDC058335 TaxID=3346451 RepID=UPI00364A7FC4